MHGNIEALCNNPRWVLESIFFISCNLSYSYGQYMSIHINIIQYISIIFNNYQYIISYNHYISY